MFRGFKDFLFRGNIIDLAVAVVIGTAFTALVTAFTAAFITPLVNSAFAVLGVSSNGVGGSVSVPGGEINFGMMVGATITFLITAGVVYFVFVAPMNKAKERFGWDQQDELTKEVALLTEIRDLLRTGTPSTETPTTAANPAEQAPRELDLRDEGTTAPARITR